MLTGLIQIGSDADKNNYRFHWLLSKPQDSHLLIFRNNFLTLLNLTFFRIFDFESKLNPPKPEEISDLKKFQPKGKYFTNKSVFLMTKNIGAGKLEIGRCLSSQSRCWFNIETFSLIKHPTSQLSEFVDKLTNFLSL